MDWSTASPPLNQSLNPGSQFNENYVRNLILNLLRAFPKDLGGPMVNNVDASWGGPASDSR